MREVTPKKQESGENTTGKGQTGNMIITAFNQDHPSNMPAMLPFIRSSFMHTHCSVAHIICDERSVFSKFTNSDRLIFLEEATYKLQENSSSICMSRQWYFIVKVSNCLLSVSVLITHLKQFTESTGLQVDASPHHFWSVS